MYFTAVILHKIWKEEEKREENTDICYLFNHFIFIMYIQWLNGVRKKNSQWVTTEVF